jgi:hypothetical protein
MPRRCWGITSVPELPRSSSSRAAANDGGAPNALFRNNGDGTFTDIAAAAGVTEGGTAAAKAADFDNDGDADLMLTADLRLYRNDGDGSFTDVTAASGLVPPAAPGGVAVGDIDGDGYLDIFWGFFITFPPAQSPGKVYRNNGDLTFTEVPGTGLELLEATVSAVFYDVNGDGLADLLSNTNLRVLPIEQPWQLHLNNGDLTFTDVTVAANFVNPDAPGSPLGPWGGLGIGLGDFDNDGDTDVCGVLNGSTINPGSGAIPPFFVPDQTPHEYFRSNGDGTYTEIAAEIGFAEIMPVTRSLAPGDYNNDGYVDMLGSGSFTTSIGTGPDKANPGTLLTNLGDGTFDAVTAPNIPVDLSNRQTGDVLRGDFNGDGFEDAVISTNFIDGVTPDGKAYLLRNLGNDNAWIKIALRGTQGNRDGIGAQVGVSAGGIDQTREIIVGTTNKTESADRVFGLDDAAQTDSISVRWPGGVVEQFPNRPAGRRVVLVEGCPWDLDGDLRVNGRDLVTVLQGLDDLYTIEDVMAVLDSMGLCDDRWGFPSPPGRPQDAPGPPQL